MNEIWRRNLIRIIFILGIQVLLLKRVSLTLGDFNYVHLTIYALIIALLPFGTNRSLLIFIAFLIGLFVDVFYKTVGVHAGATVLIAFLRYYILQVISPRDGYKREALTPYKYGIPWFLSFMAILLFIHLVAIYSLEAFSLVYIKEIILRSVFSFLASLFIVMIGILIFNPKY